MVLHKSPEEDDEYDNFWCKPGTATQIKNGAFIAELANSLPAIIAELEALRKVAEAARELQRCGHLRFIRGPSIPCPDNIPGCIVLHAKPHPLIAALSALDEVSDVK